MEMVNVKVGEICKEKCGLDALVKDPESFICKLHAQVLEVVLPIRNHPGFMHCDVTLINSIASIITHIYIGVGNVNGSRMPGVGGVGLHLIGQPLEESSISMIVEMGFSQEDDELVQALAMSLALLLVLDHLLQYKVMIHADAPGGAATTAATSSCVAVKSNLAL
ncbi:unnamed protein product [Sphagnum jensenii]|uniref:UBA domain-containing protein n=1 Tax=Sphagnum jensenii TaxID=128206 RepID=A0ABP0X842_9BRYO